MTAYRLTLMVTRKQYVWRSVQLALVAPLLGSVALLLAFPGFIVFALFWPFFLLATYYVGFPPAFLTSLYLFHVAQTQHPAVSIVSTTSVGAALTAAWVALNFGLNKDMSVVAIGCGAMSALMCAAGVVVANRKASNAEHLITQTYESRD